MDQWDITEWQRNMLRSAASRNYKKSVEVFFSDFLEEEEEKGVC